MNSFKVLLVYPNLQMVNLLPPGIAVLSAYLKQSAIEVRLFDTTFYRLAEKSVDDIRVEHMQLRPFNLKEKGIEYKDTDVYDDFISMVEDYQPDLIGITATDDTYELGMSLIARLPQKTAHVIVGGIYPTFSPTEVIQNPLVDSVCLGEGEEALLELCWALRDKKKKDGIRNLWIKSDGVVCKNPLRQPVDIDKLPFDDFGLFEEKRFFRPMQGKIYRMIPVSIDRGCPYNCTFCAAPRQREFYSRSLGVRYFRRKKVTRIINEISHFIQHYKTDYIYFNSETFFACSEPDIHEFAKLYAKKIRLPFWCQTRIETVTEGRMRLLEDMNCDRISLGIEHGNEQFRKKVLKKDFTNEQVIAAFTILERSRIPVTVNNIIGFPDETRELAFDTIKLNRRIKADSINAYFFVPYRGTPLRQYCIHKGYLVPDSKTDSLIRSSILNMPQFTREQIKGLVRTFPLYVKMPESYFKKIQVAEQLTEEGDRVLNELRGIYFKEYFR